MEFSEDTKRRIGFFREKFMKLGYGEGHYLLACHAAFPIAITPDLLYQLWANFKNYEAYLTQVSPRSIDMIAVSDLLMSNLVHPTGNEFFEMDQEVRGYLLHQLANDLRFGTPRMTALASFLYQYTDATNWDSDIKEAQHWTALATLDSEKAVGQIMEAFDGHIRNKNESEILRFRELFEAYHYQDERFTEVLEFSKGIKAEIFGYDVAVIERQFNKAKVLGIGGDINAGDRRLEIPLWETLEAKVKIFTSAEEQESWQEALRRIATAKEQEATELDLSNLGLKEIPAAAFELEKLEELDLYNNRLTKFPKEITKLKSLRKLLVSKNPIRTLPFALFRTLRNLEVLKIDDAKLKTLPQSLFQAKKLSSFSAENNQIEFLSPAIAEMKSLRLLDFRGNPILNVPERYLKATSSKIKEYFEEIPKFEKDIPVMLVLLFGDRGEGNKIDIEKERKIILKHFQRSIEDGQIHLEILNQPTTIELFQTIREVENQLVIFHFGGFSGKEGVVLWNENKQLIEVKPNIFMNFFNSLPSTAKLFLMNGCDTHIFKEGKLKLKTEALISYQGEVSDKEAIAFADYFYQNLVGKKKLETVFVETLKAIDEQNNLDSDIHRGMVPPEDISPKSAADFWQLYPPEITDLSPIKHQLKEQIAQYEINRFFQEWSKYFPEEYKKEIIGEIKKQHRTYATDKQINDATDQQAFSRIASGLLRLVDEAKIENTRAATIRNWRLFEGVDFSKLLDTPLLPLPIALVGDADLKARFNQYYQKNPSKFLDIQERITANYELRLKEDTIAIWTKEVNPKLIHGVEGFANKDMEYIVDVVEQIEKWERISNLENEQTELEKEKIEVRILRRGEKEEVDEKLIQLDKEEENNYFEIQIRNLSNIELYGTFVYFNDKFGITTFDVINLPIKENSDWLELFEIEFFLEDEEISSTETFNIVISTNPIKAKSFEETDIFPEIVKRKSERKDIGTRALSYERKIIKDWCAKKIIIKLGRPEQDWWERVKESEIELDYLEYLSLFPDGKYKEIAKKKIDKIHQKNLNSIVKSSSEDKKKRPDKGSGKVVYDDEMSEEFSKKVEFNESLIAKGLGNKNVSDKSMDIEELKRKSRELMTTDMKKALDLLYENIDDESHTFNSVINLTSRYNRNMKREMQGTAPQSSIDMSMNQVLGALNSVINDLQPQDLKNNSKT
jgi:hypothetical protein